MKSISVAILIFIISFLIGFYKASDKSIKFSKIDMDSHKTLTEKTVSDECSPDDFIVSKIEEVNKVIGKAGISSFNKLINKIKIQGIREIETEACAMTIHALCKIGDTRALEAYLKSGVCYYDINSRNKNGMTPLAIAAGNMDFDTMKVLLKFGADKERTSKVNGKEKDLIQIALDFKGHDFEEDIDKFLKLGINYEDGEKYLSQALLNSKLNFIRRILPCTDVNAVTDSGEHIFTEILETSTYRVALDYFLNNKDLALDNAPPEHPPLIAAVGNSSITGKDIIKMIKKGADVNLARSQDNSTALITSVKADRADLVEILINNGADIETRDINGKKAQDYIKDKNSKVGKLLLSVPQEL